MRAGGIADEIANSSDKASWHTTAKQTKKQAYNRFEDDLVGLQKTREQERDTFFGNIREEQMLVNAQRQF